MICVRRLIRCEHNLMCVRGGGEAGAGERHFFSGGQRGEERLKLCRMARPTLDQRQLKLRVKCQGLGKRGSTNSRQAKDSPSVSEMSSSRTQREVHTVCAKIVFHREQRKCIGKNPGRIC